MMLRNIVRIDKYNTFEFDFCMIDDNFKVVFIKIKTEKCRNKKEIRFFINSCTSLERLDLFLNKSGMGIYIDKVYQHYLVCYIDTKRKVENKKSTMIVPKNFLLGSDLD